MVSIVDGYSSQLTYIVEKRQEAYRDGGNANRIDGRAKDEVVTILRELLQRKIDKTVSDRELIDLWETIRKTCELIWGDKTRALKSERLRKLLPYIFDKVPISPTEVTRLLEKPRAPSTPRTPKRRGSPKRLPSPDERHQGG